MAFVKILLLVSTKRCRRRRQLPAGLRHPAPPAQVGQRDHQRLRGVGHGRRGRATQVLHEQQPAQGLRLLLRVAHVGRQSEGAVLQFAGLLVHALEVRVHLVGCHLDCPNMLLENQARIPTLQR